MLYRSEDYMMIVELDGLPKCGGDDLFRLLARFACKCLCRNSNGRVR
jgi:hypothetical protein